MGCNGSKVQICDGDDCFVKQSNADRRKSNATSACMSRDDSGLSLGMTDKKLKIKAVTVVPKSTSKKQSNATLNTSSNKTVSDSGSAKPDLVVQGVNYQRGSCKRPLELGVQKDSWYQAPRPNLRIAVRH